MQELSRQLLMNIHDIIHGQSYVNIKAKLDLLLPAEYAELFSKIKIMGQYGIWYGKDGITYYQYAEATQQEKEEISALIEECKNYVSENLREVMPFVDNLFIIPSKDQILWYRNNGNVGVLLTQWGFQSKSLGNNIDVIGLLLQEPRTVKQQEVTLHINYSDDAPAELTPFILNIFNNTKQLETDENGDCRLGRIFANKIFSIDSVDGINHYDYTVETGKSVYYAVFDYVTNFSVVIENHLGEPIGNYGFMLNGDHVHTDDNGIYHGNSILTKASFVSAEVDGRNHLFELRRDEDQNRFVIRLSQKVVTEPHVDECKNITITLLDIDGTPLPDLPFTIKTKKGDSMEYRTNSEGKAVIERSCFSKKEKYNIYFNVSEEYRKQLRDI